MERKIDRFLRLMNDRGASDFHLAVGRPPMLRVSGTMEQIRYRTMHTNNAVKTVDRIVNVFPSGEQEGIRNILADTLRAVVAQQLLPKIGGGRVAAIEILFSSAAIGNMIREGKTGSIVSAIQTGVNQGMIEMDASIRALFEEGIVDAHAAHDKAINKELFKDIVGDQET